MYCVMCVSECMQACMLAHAIMCINHGDVSIVTITFSPDLPVNPTQEIRQMKEEQASQLREIIF